MAASLLVPVVPCPETNSSQLAAAVSCQDFSGKMAMSVLLLWRKCHFFLCICPPGVSSLSLSTGYFLWHYCCLQSLLFIMDILTVVLYKTVAAPSCPGYVFFLPSPNPSFFLLYLPVAVTLTWVPNRHSRANTPVSSFPWNKMSASNKSCYVGTTPLFNSAKYRSELTSIPVYSLTYFLLALRGWR